MILQFFLRKMSHRFQWICMHCDPRKLRRTKTKNWSENGKEKYRDTAFQSVYEETTLPAPLTWVRLIPLPIKHAVEISTASYSTFPPFNPTHTEVLQFFMVVEMYNLDFTKDNQSAFFF